MGSMWDPTNSLIILTRELIVVGLPLAMLKISPGASWAEQASRFAWTTSSMNTKSRDCSPSPKMVRGRPSKRDLMKIGMAAAYWEPELCLCPNTLKYLNTTVSMP